MSAFLSRVRKIPIEITKNLNVLLLNESLNNVSRRIEDELRNHGVSMSFLQNKASIYVLVELKLEYVYD